MGTINSEIPKEEVQVAHDEAENDYGDNKNLKEEIKVNKKETNTERDGLKKRKDAKSHSKKASSQYHGENKDIFTNSSHKSHESVTDNNIRIVEN